MTEKQYKRLLASNFESRSRPGRSRRWLPALLLAAAVLFWSGMPLPEVSSSDPGGFAEVMPWGLAGLTVYGLMRRRAGRERPSLSGAWRRISGTRRI